MWQVVWSDAAFDQMQVTIKNHPEHKAVFAAVLRELNQRLWEGARTEGESRGDDLRITFTDPFVIDFQV